MRAMIVAVQRDAICGGQEKADPTAQTESDGENGKDTSQGKAFSDDGPGQSRLGPLSWRPCSNFARVSCSFQRPEVCRACPQDHPCRHSDPEDTSGK